MVGNAGIVRHTETDGGVLCLGRRPQGDWNDESENFDFRKWGIFFQSLPLSQNAAGWGGGGEQNTRRSLFESCWWRGGWGDTPVDLCSIASINGSLLRWLRKTLVWMQHPTTVPDAAGPLSAKCISFWMICTRALARMGGVSLGTPDGGSWTWSSVLVGLWWLGGRVVSCRVSVLQQEASWHGECGGSH